MSIKPGLVIGEIAKRSVLLVNQRDDCQAEVYGAGKTSPYKWFPPIRFPSYLHPEEIFLMDGRNTLDTGRKIHMWAGNKLDIPIKVVPSN